MSPAKTESTGFQLEDVPGIGPAMAGRIRAAYGSDSAFLDACRSLDLERILSLEGLGERRAFDLVARIRSDHEPPLVRTARARHIASQVEDMLVSYARTSYGRNALRVLPVLRDPEAIGRQAQAVMKARRVVEATDRAAVQAALARLGRPKHPARLSGVDRLVVTDTEEDELALREAGVDRWCRIASGRDAARRVPDHELVVYAWRTGDLGLDMAPNVFSMPLAEAVDGCIPERDIAWVEENRRTLGAMAELARLVDRSSVAPRLLQAADEAASAKRIDVRAVAQEALTAAETVFAEAVGDVSLRGKEVLELLAGGRSSALEAARKQAVAAGRRVFEERIGRALDPFTPGLPVRIDEEELARIESEIQARGAVDAFQRNAAAAAVVRGLVEEASRELSAWFRFDVEYALGCYAVDADAVPAETGRELRVAQGLNLVVVRARDAQRVDYHLDQEVPVAILTGANSGGKTTLMEMLAQIAILHHWGLPVPAHRAVVPVLDEVLVFGASRGLDAGAFETFLRELFPPLTVPGRKLILLDEVESATELEAAGRILGVFIDEVARTDSLCVLVTHLPEAVLANARVPVRVDGIDAVGLDDRFNLIVDRQPKLGHRARSTPELILRRVHARAKGPEKEVYARILARWS